MPRADSNHYAALGLDADCTTAQIRAAYRLLAKQYHPDLNPNSTAALTQTQALNAAYAILTDPEQRAAYDRDLAAQRKAAPSRAPGITQRNITQDVNLRIEDFLRGTTREVQVTDPANPNGGERYQLVVPPGTAPGTRFRLPRGEPFGGGYVQIRVRALPGYQFKVRGSDLRCDLKISVQRATLGGMEMLPGVTGARLRVPIPRRVARHEIIRLPGEGLPKARGGRGDLLVRILYRPEVRITRSTAR